MTLADLTSRSIRPTLLVLGAVVAPLLAGLGIFGLGDAEVSARAQLTREAKARVGGLQSLWAERLMGAAPIARTVGEVFTLTPAARPLSAAPAPAAATGEADASLARLLLLSARADFGNGEFERALAQCQRAIETSGESSGEALLLCMQIASLSDLGSADASDLYQEAVDAVPYRAAVNGTSGRLLALLTAAPLLDSPTHESASADLARALTEGEVVLPAPLGDRVELAAEGWRFQSDPWWSALETACAERLGAEGVDWPAAFHREHRRTAGIAAHIRTRFPEELASMKPDRWRVLGDSAPRVAVRHDENGTTHVALHTEAALDRALQSLLPDGDDFTASAFVPQDDATPLVAPVALAGAPAFLHLAARPGSGTLRSVTFRIRALRAGLLTVAALLALAAIAAWRTLTREARLRDLRSTFVASVSHDLRTPVASISLLASNLSSGYASGSESKYLDSIQGEAARLRRLVDDLLDFGRLERGLPPRIQREPVELVAWLESFAAKERARCHTLGCALDLVTEALPPSAQLDVAALERGLSNLIDNAIKHGRATGAVLRVRGEGSMLSFEIEDAGSGLSPAALRADLFQPFERGSAQSAGTGLGLSIVRAIAEGHGGSASLRPGHEGIGVIATLNVSMGDGQAA